MSVHGDDDGISSDGSAAGPSLPAGVLRTRTAWEGDELEMDRTRDHIRAAADDDDRSRFAPGSVTKAYAAVDISQFQNTEIGSGYQAKHVVRQRSAAGGKLVDIRDMTHREAHEGSKKAGKRERRENDAADHDGSSATRPRKRSEKGPPSGAEEYLKCKGIRVFLMEIEKILSSA